MTRTLIIVPMKAPDLAKTRLADALDAQARLRLVRHLYRRSLAFLKPIAAEFGAGLSVVTASPAAAGVAEAAGVAVLREPSGCGLSGAATAAARQAREAGWGRICVIPADLAAPCADDVARLLRSTADVVVCPSVDGGTNALLVAPPDAIRFCYGPRSARRHLEQAHRRGLSAELTPLESLSFDIDTQPCLRRAMSAAPDLRAACG